MKYRVFIKIWLLVSISFLGFIIGLTFFMVIEDINIITKPLPTLVSLAIVIPMTILILSGSLLLDKLKKRDLGID